MDHTPARPGCTESRFPCGLLPMAAVLLAVGLFLLLGQGKAGATEPGSPLAPPAGVLAAPGDPLPGGEQSQPAQPGQPAQPNQPPSTPTTPTTPTTVQPVQPRNEQPRTEHQHGANRDDDDDKGPLALLLGLVGLIGGGLVGLVIGLLIGRGRRQGAPAAAPVAAPAPAAGPVGRQREVLVLAAIDSRDQVTSQALGDRLGRALWEAGITEVRADGQRFDPRLHQAVDQVATADPNLDGVIASTERPGYTDNGRVIRLPEVVVHRLAR